MTALQRANIACSSLEGAVVLLERQAHESNPPVTLADQMFGHRAGGVTIGKSNSHLDRREAEIAGFDAWHGGLPYQPPHTGRVLGIVKDDPAHPLTEERETAASSPFSV